jgi:hypothetical protein
VGTTVVIPQRNRGGARLWNCLNALVRQSVAPEEVIVVDLSSAPENIENIRWITRSFGFTFLCVQWRDPRFNRALAINCGIRAARSTNVLALDVDAVAAPHYVESCTARIKEDTLLLCEHRRGRSAAEGEDISSDWGAYCAISSRTLWARCAAGMSMGARRAFWVKISGVDERFIGWGAEDDHAVWKAEQLGRVDWIDDPLIVHQDHPDVEGKGEAQGRNHEMFDRLRAQGVSPRPWGQAKVRELVRG